MNELQQPTINWKWYNQCAKEILEEDKTDGALNQPIPTNFPLIDELLGGGFKKGELAILSAPTKQGKSTLAQTITWNMSKNGTKSLWFTMEMSWQELTRKFMAMDERMKTDNLPSQNPIHYPIENYYKGGDLQMKWLKDTISEAQKTEHTEFVVIDHLHFLLPLKDYQTNTSFLIGSIVREIKKIAVELQIPIMLIAHTTKLEMGKTPTINDIRDSSFIAQESDFAMMMWRIMDKNASTKTSDDEDADTQVVYTNKAWLSLEANRRTGRTGRVKLFHDGSKFVPYSEEQKEQDKLNNFTKFAKDKIKSNEPRVMDFSKV